ncbi:hypothetical protein Pmani_005427 [Petrolisthes manimaculis]|uniref:Uncharacterized protein n=1 Tax=Petrolisthes manimaculis TaxID=1843537 RepID=A0AAE1UMY0_9EUCA|nr:hypothetical protein Pmani_005427 [Petrolisthes manimaculis]
MSWISVEKLLHWNNPTLSAAEVRVQWHKKLLRLGTSLAAVDGQDFFRALTCSSHSTVRCWTAFQAVESIRFSHPAKGVAQGVAAAHANSFWGPLVRAGCHVGANSG